MMAPSAVMDGIDPDPNRIAEAKRRQKRKSKTEHHHSLIDFRLRTHRSTGYC
jgi:hypothetical protein